MKRSVLGGIIAFTLVLCAALAFTIYGERLGSELRMKQYDDALAVLGDRVEALEKQKLLLEESAAALDKEALRLRRSAELIGVEVDNIRNLVVGVKHDTLAPAFDWRSFDFTPSSGLIVIAFLFCIWMLYVVIRGRSSSPSGEESFEHGRPLSAGSLKEEEFPATPPSGGADGPSEGSPPAAGAEEPAEAPLSAGQEGEAPPEAPPEANPGEEQKEGA